MFSKSFFFDSSPVYNILNSPACEQLSFSSKLKSLHPHVHALVNSFIEFICALLRYRVA